MSPQDKYRQDAHYRWLDCKEQLTPEPKPKRKHQDVRHIFRIFKYLIMLEFLLFWVVSLLLSWALFPVLPNKVIEIILVPAKFFIGFFAKYCHINWQDNDRATLAYKLARKHPEYIIGVLANIQYHLYLKL